jgi:hypothetical protein
MTVRDDTNPTDALDLKPIARPSLDLIRVGDRFLYQRRADSAGDPGNGT